VYSSKILSYSKCWVPAGNLDDDMVNSLSFTNATHVNESKILWLCLNKERNV
jgi:hypothetical protein